MVQQAVRAVPGLGQQNTFNCLHANEWLLGLQRISGQTTTIMLPGLTVFTQGPIVAFVTVAGSCRWITGHVILAGAVQLTVGPILPWGATCREHDFSGYCHHESHKGMFFFQAEQVKLEIVIEVS